MDIEALFAIFLVLLFILLPLLRQKEKAGQASTIQHTPPSRPKKAMKVLDVSIPLQEKTRVPPPPQGKAPNDTSPIPPPTSSKRRSLVLSYEILSPPVSLRD